ncbi:MAG: 50S ribosome-binding GTPase [Candidatus Ratteibacteria bacterium]|nr:50S ribosome-binding GTPase [Candidatus Ratteibacteria bacterium]
MPANLTPQYHEAEKEYRQAKTYTDKVEALKKMLAVIPKHKGTEKLQADLKTKISKLSKISQKKSAKKEADSLSHIDKEGAGQVILIGKPNVGKSQIISGLTNSNSPVTPYPFATRKPIVGMMEFEDIKIQLIDTPSITKTFTERYLFPLIREADIVLLVIDLTQEDILEQVEEITDILRDESISLKNETGEDLLLKKCILIGNKNDSPKAEMHLNVLKELYSKDFPDILSISALKGNWVDFKKQVFDKLEVIRVYTKQPGKPFEKGEPFIMKKGANVQEVAIAVHKDFENLKFARLWDNGNYSGQRVERGYVLKDKDILELHM